MYAHYEHLSKLRYHQPFNKMQTSNMFSTLLERASFISFFIVPLGGVVKHQDQSV